MRFNINRTSNSSHTDEEPPCKGAEPHPYVTQVRWLSGHKHSEMYPRMESDDARWQRFQQEGFNHVRKPLASTAYGGSAYREEFIRDEHRIAWQIEIDSIWDLRAIVADAGKIIIYSFPTEKEPGEIEIYDDERE